MLKTPTTLRAQRLDGGLPRCQNLNPSELEIRRGSYIMFSILKGLRCEMTCPKCGLLTLPEQKFCRSCGASLQALTQPLAETSTISQLEDQSAIAVKDESQRGSRLVLWGFIIMFLGTAIGIIGKMLLHESIVTVVGILLSLAGMFLTVYPYLLPPRRPKNDSSSRRKISAQSQPKSLQESRVEYVPSITERTTDLLKNPATPIHKQKEGGA